MGWLGQLRIDLNQEKEKGRDLFSLGSFICPSEDRTYVSVRFSPYRNGTGWAATQQRAHLLPVTWNVVVFLRPIPFNFECRSAKIGGHVRNADHLAKSLRNALIAGGRTKHGHK